MIGRKLIAMQHLEGFQRRIRLTPAAVAKVLQLLREFRRSFSLVFLKSWGERTLRFLPLPGRPRVFPVSWNFFTIFHTVERFIPAVLQFQQYFFNFFET